MYLAILPQFISPDGNTAIQALVLSALFILGCGLVYSSLLVSCDFEFFPKCRCLRNNRPYFRALLQT